MSFFQNPHNSKWLIAFDNVDDVNIDLPKFFPQCDHGAILVTSRNQSLGLLASEPQFHLQLDVMSQDEAIEVITKSARRPRLSPGESKAVSDITERLGYLPIALSQAGCYMAETGCSAAEYLELLSESRIKLLDRPSRSRQKECAYAALDISYKRLPIHIQKFMHILSFYHFANFPMSTISQAAANAFRQDPFPFAARGPEFETQIQLLNEIFLTDGEWTNFQLQEWILVLQSYSMASFTTNSDTKLLRIHPLIRDWAFDRLSSERRVEFQGAALRLLAACMDEGRDLRLLPPHAAAFLSRSDPEYLSINDRAALGKILRGQDQNAAQAIWLPIYNTCHDLVSGPYIVAARSTGSLSIVPFWPLGWRLKRGSPDPNNTLRLEYGIDHLHVATAALETAEAYGEMNLEQAEALESEAIRIRTLSLGPRHLDTLKATVSLSGTWYYQEKYQKAFEKIEHCLKFMKEQLSAAHPYVLRIEKVFAGMQMKQHNNRESEVVQQRILETLIAERGETHPETLFAMLILGWTQGKSGHYSEAEALLERVVELRKTLSGEADGATLAAMATLAGTYHEHGRYADAEAVQLKILEQRIARSGDDDGDTRIARSRLAATYRSQGRYIEAEEQLLKAFESHKRECEEANSDPIFGMDELALTYCEHGRHSEAETIQSSILEKRETQLGGENKHTLTAMFNLGCTYYHQGRYFEAGQLLEKAMEGRKAKCGEEDPDTLAVMSKLAVAKCEQSHYSEAEALQLKVLQAKRRQLWDGHRDILLAMQSLALTQQKRNDASTNGLTLVADE
ncbi:hypothetical protein M408DRAFT_219250 [Serendipita vermifera MAFF 305830]|uniref:NB-ARC domain-containing protein n=1 Tax=Serendipita vermifera MAFF 305830 TaxID=933852 RepID=A0A0C3BK50_SERVB|nr:hypothetical protein M408DRAFT_219250 [Serendipita vermifera MAFF 305830]